MKNAWGKYSVLLSAILVAGIAYGQNNEVSVQVNSGFFSFGGKSASETSSFNVSDVTSESGYTNNPYGRSSGFSFGLAAQVQRITRYNFIMGVQAGYESLSSKTKIDNAFGDISWTVADGKTILTNQFINITPFLGKRFNVFRLLKTDLTAGFDLGLCRSSKEHYEITTDHGDNITGSRVRHKPDIDVRSRIDLTNYYRRFGLALGYSHGLTNYTAGLIGANFENRSRYFRIGVSYLLN